MKSKWIAGYLNPEDWYIAENTAENRDLYADMDGDYYESFSAAKRAILTRIRERINMDRAAMRNIKRMTRKDAQR